MTDLSPERIEALDPSDIVRIRTLAAELHSATPGVLEILSPKDLEHQENLRLAMKSKLDEAMSQLSRQIADLNALKTDLRIAKTYQTTDAGRIKSAKIALYVAQKELREHPYR